LIHSTSLYMVSGRNGSVRTIAIKSIRKSPSIGSILSRDLTLTLILSSFYIDRKCADLICNVFMSVSTPLSALL